MSNDVLQVLFFGAVGTVAVFALWYIFVQAPKARTMMLAPWAQKRGLHFTPPVSLGAHTTGSEVSVLQGTVQGVGLTVRSSRLVNSRRAGLPGATEISVRAHAPRPLTFNIECVRTPAPPEADSFQTGDRMFDARVRTRSDNVQAAQAWLRTHLQGALPLVVQDTGSVIITYAGGNTSVRIPKPIASEAELDRIIGLALAAAHAQV
ncbi:hypothetical protein AKJ09_10379 [Labilithrix luteola]|uniref:Uncharacterized protein n=1 Tax=Labilithrix luteola TaxID=1391654 RepID=A0A0K1QD80_9BACT|nr:hypothetical protein [Labilithrix luteola]AKV03716.1 hypothetical protein AKJ09_10379 [Labilithrix luteola]